MSKVRPVRPEAYPGARSKHVHESVKGSTRYFVHLLADARRVASRHGVDVDACWVKAGGIVAADRDHVVASLVEALRGVLVCPGLNRGDIDQTSAAAITVANEALGLITE